MDEVYARIAAMGLIARHIAASPAPGAAPVACLHYGMDPPPPAEIK